MTLVYVLLARTRIPNSKNEEKEKNEGETWAAFANGGPCPLSRNDLLAAQEIEQTVNSRGLIGRICITRRGERKKTLPLHPEAYAWKSFTKPEKGFLLKDGLTAT